jgi:hypothetical protein
MVSHMKTTIEISDALMRAARRQARARGLTLRALVEEGLRLVLQGEATRKQFQLRRASFKGEGLADPTVDWADIRDTTYRGRGS